MVSPKFFLTASRGGGPAENVPHPALGVGICHSLRRVAQASLWLAVSIRWIFRLFHATESCRWVFARLVARSDCHCRGPRRSRRNDARAIRRAGELTQLADSPVCRFAKKLCIFLIFHPATQGTPAPRPLGGGPSERPLGGGRPVITRRLSGRPLGGGRPAS